MKSLAKILLLSAAILTGCSGLGYSQRFDYEYRVFNSDKNERYLKEIRILNSKDNLSKVARCEYDIDQNGKVETHAFYKVNRIEGSKFYINKNAHFLLVDENQDGLFDYVFIDSDRNGVLDKRKDF